MTLHIASWEHPLLNWAFEALDDRHTVDGVDAAPEILARAYRRCEDITARHSRTFHLASGLLPPAKRRAARALYAFCRVSDDCVDRPRTDAPAALTAWRARVLSPCPDTDDPVVLAWADARRRFHIPSKYVEQLFDGLSKDLYPTRYATFGDLAQYAYGVASTVGLMVMHIIGFESRRAIPYAVRLGVALQMTNILRDVGEDWQAGRLYLPQEELDAFGVCEENIAAGDVTERWQALMAFQIRRNRQLYHEAHPGIGLLQRDGRMAIAAAADLYRAILDDIAAHRGDVFSRRAHVSTWRKVRRLPGIWWRSQRARPTDKTDAVAAR